MKTSSVPCALCGAEEDYVVLYKEHFKDADINIDTFSARRLPQCVHYRIVRCKNDGLIRSNPVLDEAELSDLYRKAKFTYEEETENLVVSYLDVVNGVLPHLSRNAKILEIGCGNGFILKALYERGYRNVFGVEPSSHAVGKADKNIKANIRQDMLRPGLFQDGSFDLILCFHTLDHVKDPNNFLKICFELLIDNGHVVALSHDIESLAVKLFKQRSPAIDIQHTFFYSQQTIKSLFEKNGFRALKVYPSKNVVSLKHFLWLFPLPMFIKRLLMNSSSMKPLFNKRLLKLKLGDMCVIAQRADN